MQPTTPRRPVRFRPHLELLECRLQPGSLLTGLGAALADTTLSDLNAAPAPDHATLHRSLGQTPANPEAKPGQVGAGAVSAPSLSGSGATALIPVVTTGHSPGPSAPSLVEQILAVGAAGRHAPLGRPAASAATTAAPAAGHSGGSAAPVLPTRVSGMVARPIPTQGGVADHVVVLPDLVKTIPVKFAAVKHWQADDRDGPPPPDSGLEWATYVTGTGTSAAGLAVATDAGRNSYVAGSNGQGDGMVAFVAKYDNTGRPIYYTEFQAIDPDPGFTYGATAAHAIAVDGDGNAYVTGVAVRLESGNTQAFAMKLDVSGNAVPGYGGGLANTPTSDSSGDAIAVDAAGQATLVGSAQIGHTQETVAVAVKYNARGGAIPIYAAGYQFPGFFTNSAAKALALDATADNAYIVGSGLPPGATQDDILAFKIDNTGPQAGQHYSYALSAANDGEDVLNGVAVDAAGNAYVAGTVTDTGQLKAYVAEINSLGNNFVYTDVFDGTLSGTAISRDETRNVSYVTGSILGQDDGLVHAVVAEIDSLGLPVDAYITAGDTQEVGQGVSFSVDSVFVIGTTGSTNLSTDGTTLNGDSDAFLMKVTNFN